MTLKEIIDTVLRQSGVSTETAYASSSNDSVLRLVDLANQSVAMIARHPWQALRRIYTFTLSTDTQYDLPADFRSLASDTMYSDTDQEGLDFPASEEKWSYLKASSSGSSGTQVRIIADKINVHEPDSGSTVRFEYNSKYPITDSTGAFKERFTADTDSTVLQDDLVISELLWRYKKLVGLSDWQVDLAESKDLMQTLKGLDGGSKTVGPHEEGFVTPYYDLWRPVPNS